MESQSRTPLFKLSVKLTWLLAVRDLYKNCNIKIRLFR